jgi:hypothetical protein
MDVNNPLKMVFFSVLTHSHFCRDSTGENDVLNILNPESHWKYSQQSATDTKLAARAAVSWIFLSSGRA